MVDNDDARSLLTDLYDKYRGGLFRCAYRLTGNAHDAEDIVHDAFGAAAANEKKAACGK
ncbi:MAG: hypothetical protein II191_00785 [Clostridia bacterium]|nr:hypothetical protein [Clostridia bacterium]